MDLVPRPDDSAYPNFVAEFDFNGDETGFGGGTLIPFSTTQIANTPDLVGRFALMDLELVGNTGIARQFETFEYTFWDQSLNAGDGGPVTCYGAFELTIVFTVQSANALTGWFTFAESDTCNEFQEFSSFQVNFTR